MARTFLLAELMAELEALEKGVKKDGAVGIRERFLRWQRKATQRLREQFDEDEAKRLEQFTVPRRDGWHSVRFASHDLKAALQNCKSFFVALAEEVETSADGVAAKPADSNERVKDDAVTNEGPKQMPKIQLSEAEAKWLGWTYNWFKRGFLLDVDKASQAMFEKGEWATGFRPNGIDERLLVDGNKPTLLGVQYADPGATLLPLTHDVLSTIKKRLSLNRKEDRISVNSLAPDVGAPPDQVSRALDLIWLAGDFIKSLSHTRTVDPNRQDALPIYDSLQVGSPIIYEEYEKYENLDKLIADRYGDTDEKQGMSAGTTIVTTSNMILGRYELLKALVGHKEAIERKLTRFPFDKNVFIMMKYRASNKALSDFIKEELEKHGLRGVRADDLEWNITRDIYNPLAVLYCCKYGLALFDEPEEGQIFSPNVAYELGIMHYQQKNCLILKNTNLPTSPFDLLKDLHKPYSRDLDVRSMIRDWITEISEE